MKTRPMTVSAIQTIAVPGDLAQSVQDHVRLATRGAREGASIAVFPELSLTGYSRRLTHADALSPTDQRIAALRELAVAHRILVIAGAPVSSSIGLHIGALCFLPNGSVSVYTKRFLHEGEEKAFAAGNGGDALVVEDRTVCVAICAEVNNSKHAEDAAARGAHLYVASSFLTPTGYDDDTTLLRSYACRYRMTVLMANYGAATSEWPSAGKSAIWSATAELLAQAGAEGEAVVLAKVSP
jgi:predicted amidohydrolase